MDGATWEYGTDLAYLQELCAYWRDRYDWRAQEAALNGFRQFTARVGGIDLHFIHELGEGPNPRPLLLSHGWPGSFFEYHRLIPRLTHPSRFGGSAEDAFSVVVPSLPGHGFSFTPGQRRFSIGEIADCLSTLMVDVLGHETFIAHGHDWGSFISTRLGYAHAERVRGIHITLLAIPRRPTPPRTPEEQRFQQQLDCWLREETGYSQIMGTRPQTLAYALTDSPAGLAAWIVEKFRRWSDCAGDLDAHFGKDTLLTNLMLYWATGAIGSTFWPYYARLHEPWIVPDCDKRLNIQLRLDFSSVPPGEARQAGREGLCDGPDGVCRTPQGNPDAAQSLAEPLYGNIRRWTRMPGGGHFPALEFPDALAADIRAFFSEIK